MKCYLLKKYYFIPYFFGFLEAGLLVLMMFASMSFDPSSHYNGFYTLVSSDPSLLYQISEDFLKHPASLLDWDFGTCFYLFPNLILMTILDLLFFNPAFVLFINSLLIFSLQLLFINLLFNKVSRGISKFNLIIANLAILAFMVYTIKSGDFINLTPHLFLPLHSGAFINTLIGLFLIFSYHNSNNKRYIFLLSALIILAVFSDTIFIIFFLAPVLVSFLVIFIFRPHLRRRGLYIPGLSILISGITGYLIFLFITKNGLMHLYPLMSHPDNIQSSFQLMVSNLADFSTRSALMSVVAGLTLASLIGSVVIAAGLVFKTKDSLDNVSLNYLFYFLFSVFFFICSLAAPVLNGSYLGIDCIRYIMPSLFLQLFNLGLIIEYFTRNSLKGRILSKILAISLLVLYGSFIVINFKQYPPRLAIRNVQGFYPSIARATDKLFKKYHFRNGLGGYWDARYISIFSKEAVNVSFAGSGMNPVYWANNPHHYLFSDYKENSKTIYNFLVLRSFEDSSAIHKYFKPSEIDSITIDGFKFYLFPDLVARKDLSEFEARDNTGNH